MQSIRHAFSLSPQHFKKSFRSILFTQRLAIINILKPKYSGDDCTHPHIMYLISIAYIDECNSFYNKNILKKATVHCCKYIDIPNCIQSIKAVANDS